MLIFFPALRNNLNGARYGVRDFYCYKLKQNLSCREKHTRLSTFSAEIAATLICGRFHYEENEESTHVISKTRQLPPCNKKIVRTSSIVPLPMSTPITSQQKTIGKIEVPRCREGLCGTDNCRRSYVEVPAVVSLARRCQCHSDISLDDISLDDISLDDISLDDIFLGLCEDYCHF